MFIFTENTSLQQNTSLHSTLLNIFYSLNFTGTVESDRLENEGKSCRLCSAPHTAHVTGATLWVNVWPCETKQLPLLVTSCAGSMTDLSSPLKPTVHSSIK